MESFEPQSPREATILHPVSHGALRALVVGWINADDISQTRLEQLPKSNQLADLLRPAECIPGSGHIWKILRLMVRTPHYLRDENDRYYALLWLFRIAARTAGIPAEFPSTTAALNWAALESGDGAIKVFACVGIRHEDSDRVGCLDKAFIVGATKTGGKTIGGRRTYLEYSPEPDAENLITGRHFTLIGAGAPAWRGVFALDRVARPRKWCDIGCRITLDYSAESVKITPQSYPTYSVYLWNGDTYELQKAPLGSSTNPWHNFREERRVPPEFAD